MAPTPIKKDSYHLILGFFVLLLFFYLTFQAQKPYHLSDWHIGDAQSMLSYNQWEKGGWLNNYLLFVPQGYASFMNIFDSEDLRHHAHGISPKSSLTVGPRLRYTHYPAGYLIPYALLYSLGLTSLTTLQIFSICISLTGLIFMFRTFSIITSPRVALVATISYGISLPFLGYADSLANMPIDDLLRFAFMLTVVLSTRSGLHRTRWLIIAWLLEFCLSLSSFDSVFFVYVWLVGWHILEEKRIPWKIIFIFALAPISAHGLQVLQNIWYLGTETAIRDLSETFIVKQSHHEMSRLATLGKSLQRDIVPLFRPLWLFAVTLLLYMTGYYLLPHDRELPSPLLILLLFLCGLAYIVILPSAAGMEYQGRQLAPFTSMLAGGIVAMFIQGWTFQGNNEVRAAQKTRKPHLFWLADIAVIMLIIGLSNVYPNSPQSWWEKLVSSGNFTDHLLAETLREIPTEYEPVYFMINAKNSRAFLPYKPNYPQIMPELEYLAGNRLILCFKSPELALQDLRTITRMAGKSFSPVIISPRKDDVLYLYDALSENAEGERLLPDGQEGLRYIYGNFVLDLTPYLNSLERR